MFSNRACEEIHWLKKAYNVCTGSRKFNNITRSMKFETSSHLHSDKYSFLTYGRSEQLLLLSFESTIYLEGYTKCTGDLHLAVLSIYTIKIIFLIQGTHQCI
jgi:hypothetical protein